MSWPRRASPCRYMYNRNLQITSIVAARNMVSYGCNAVTVTMNTRLRLVASGADFASAVVAGIHVIKT